jgi:hypothetical protein
MNSQSRLFPVATVVVFVACGVFVWHSVHEGQQKIAEANQTVVAHINDYLPKAFSEWHATVPSTKPLVPDTLYSGQDSVIVAIQPTTDYRGFNSRIPAWDVLAKSATGRYFTLHYRLCADCDVDSGRLQWKRLDDPEYSNNAMRVLSVEEAKDWLYRAGKRKEFKAEFGTDAPPAAVAG